MNCTVFKSVRDLWFAPCSHTVFCENLVLSAACVFAALQGQFLALFMLGDGEQGSAAHSGTILFPRFVLLMPNTGLQ